MKGFNRRLLDTTLPIMPRTGRELRRLLDLASTRNPHFQQVLLSDPAASIAVSPPNPKKTLHLQSNGTLWWCS